MNVLSNIFNKVVSDEMPMSVKALNPQLGFLGGLVVDTAINEARKFCKDIKAPEELRIVGYKDQVERVQVHVEHYPFEFDTQEYFTKVKHVPVYANVPKQVTTGSEILDSVIGTAGDCLLNIAGNITGIDTRYKEMPYERIKRAKDISRMF